MGCRLKPCAKPLICAQRWSVAPRPGHRQGYGLIDLVRAGRFSADQNVRSYGGIPGLFAYEDVLIP
jgi:hypothetical protein